MQKSRIINWARSSNESEKKKTQRAMEMSVLSSPSQQDPSPSDPPSKESFPLKRQKPILKTSDSSSSWDTPEAKLVQFRVTGSESDADVEGQAVQNVNLDIAPPTENNTQTVGTSPAGSSANSFSSSSVTSQSRLLSSPERPHPATLPVPLPSRPSSERLAERRKRLKRTRSGSLLKLADSEESLKLALYYHICNPLKRWKTERTVPYSLLLQLVKTGFVIVQVVMFVFALPSERSVFTFESREILEQLFIKNFDSSHEDEYYVVYTPGQFFNETDFAISQYYSLPELTIGGYGHELDSSGNIQPVNATLKQYAMASIHPSNNSYIFNGTVVESHFSVYADSDISSELPSLSFVRMVELQLHIVLYNIRFIKEIAECHKFFVTLIYTNADQKGKILYKLHLESSKQLCNGTGGHFTAEYIAYVVFSTIVDIITIILSVMTTVAAILNHYEAYRLGKAMGWFYENKLKTKLSWWERRSLFSPWLVFNMLTAVLVIIGSFGKMFLQFEVLELDSVGVRILLGTALVMQSTAILRFTSYFKQLNALTRTLSAAFPELLKFLLCTSILFIAFSICGYVVFSPYTPRFTSIFYSFEMLFALMNGDDMYPTFRAFSQTDNLSVYVYSRFFVYIFVSLFLYAVLNLFTSLVISSYEYSQSEDRANINEVRRFVFSGPLTPEGVALRDITYVRKYVDPQHVLNRKANEQRRRSYFVDMD